MIETMAKKVVSFVPIYNKKLTKWDNKKKKVLHKLKKVLEFLKSDVYMFAPLVSSQTSDHVDSCCTTSIGIQAYEPFEVKNEDMFGKVKDYMKSDCYMYAPLVTHQPWLRSPIHAVSPATGTISCSEMALTGRKGESVKNVAEETRDIGQKIKRISIADQHVDGYSYPRSTIIKHTVLQQETLKHVIKQSCWSASVQGDMRKEKKGRKWPKPDGSNAIKFVLL
ncbi:uncharacterized protein LOC113776438 isoform X2 [Coffea eugenioides]|uniref:uncharacterized protein LOC113776438 isoform X2 n=1 Tax=Coffea eugenioides TaxID=49369 RepID=UPI000F6152F8|nr:uncharacterized protein LOC113776438 isoform X2 [Coffea eugenioides]